MGQNLCVIYIYNFFEKQFYYYIENLTEMFVSLMVVFSGYFLNDYFGHVKFFSVASITKD